MVKVSTKLVLRIHEYLKTRVFEISEQKQTQGSGQWPPAFTNLCIWRIPWAVAWLEQSLKLLSSEREASCHLANCYHEMWDGGSSFDHTTMGNVVPIAGKGQRDFSLVFFTLSYPQLLSLALFLSLGYKGNCNSRKCFHSAMKFRGICFGTRASR